MAPRRSSDMGASKRSKCARPQQHQLEDIQCGREGPLASVIRTLPRKSRIALAATCSAMMAAVLESCDGARWRSRHAGSSCAEAGRVGQTVARRLEGRVSEGTRSEVGWATGRGEWVVYHRAGTCDVGVPSAVVRVEGGDRDLLRALAQTEAGRRELASAPAVSAEMTGLRCLDVAVSGLDVVGVWGREWLPAGVAAGITELQVCFTRLERVPEGMVSLEVLDVTGCERLEGETFLPASSAGRVRVLRADFTSLRRVPEGMCALEELSVRGCRRPDEACLPASSAAGLRVLRADYSDLGRLPAGMRALRELHVTRCTRLQPELALTGAVELRVLAAGGTGMRRVPEGLTALEVLDVRGCKQLDGEAFLPASCAARLRVLRASFSSVRKLPRGMDALEELDLASCRELDWEDAAEVLGGAMRLRVLRASYSDMRRLPEGLCALEELYVDACKNLTGKLEQSVADRLRRWNVEGSALVLPDGMKETHFG